MMASLPDRSACVSVGPPLFCNGPSIGSGTPVWSVVCFFVENRFRGRGLTVGLLEAAADHARRRGGTLLEGYPVEPRKKNAPSVFMNHGLASAFRRAEFTEVARRSETRPIMRRELG